MWYPIRLTNEFLKCKAGGAVRYKHAPERVFLILERHICLLLLKFGLELRRRSSNGQHFSAGHLTVTPRAVGQPDNEAEDAKRLLSQSSA
jgi:hypothetical protein